MDYMQGVDEENFMASSMLQDAIIRIFVPSVSL
jgi:uncharacterized protein with HEPN domain